MGKGWWGPRRVAKHLDCSRSQVYTWVHEGELEAIKTGQILRISLESLEAFENRHRVRAEERALKKFSA